MANERIFNRKKSNSTRVKEMSATSIINNSKFFRTTSRRNSTSSVNMVNSTLMNNFTMSNNLQYNNLQYNGYAKNSLVAANAGNYRLNGNQYGRRLSSGAALATNVRRCQSMRQSENGLFYDADEEVIYDEDARYKAVTHSTGLSTRRASQVDGGYHSNGSLTSSDSYSSYTKYSNKDNPLSSIRVHIVDECQLTHCLESKFFLFIIFYYFNDL